MRRNDLVFIGHMCFDEVVPYQGKAEVRPGSAVLCGAMAAARVGKRVGVITRMRREDDAILEPMRALGIDCTLIPTADTTYMYVAHHTADVDHREIVQKRSAGFFHPGEIPELDAWGVHLAGITDQEFTVEFLDALKARGLNVSVDMQDFVRRVDPVTGNVTFEDVAGKQKIAALANRIKLDVVEAQILTGTSDLEAAARQFEAWGAVETVVTQAAGVLVRAGGRTYYEKFSNRNVSGRTGRGDTTFAGYLARRIDHDIAESLRFAAALVSLKMETPGPFSGDMAAVLTRMAACHQG